MAWSANSVKEMLIQEAVGTIYEGVVSFEGGITEPEIPGPFVLLAPATGAGLSTEWVTDIRGLDAVVAGNQNDYQGAEDLAFWVDRIILGAGGSRRIGGDHIVNVSRFGSAPYNTEQDDADRYRFTCSYLYEVQSGLMV